MPVVSFTHDRAQILIRVAILPPEDAPDPTRMKFARGLIDTGAVATGIVPAIAADLQLPRLGKTIITTPAGDYVARRFQFRLGLFPDLPGESTLPHVLPHELLGIGCSPGQAFEVLIGMDILGRGDLTISSKGHGSFAFS